MAASIPFEDGPLSVLPFVICGLVVGVIFLLLWASNIQPYSSIRKKPQGLVICPQGIALIQGEATGEQKWERITGTGIQSKGSPVGFQLFLEPRTTLVVADTFTCPAQQIKRVIEKYMAG